MNNVAIGGSTPLAGSFTTATANSYNKMAITAPSTSSTLAVADGKTFTASKTLTLTGTDSTTMTFPTTSATIARTDAAQTFTGTQTFGGVIASTVVSNFNYSSKGNSGYGTGLSFNLTLPNTNEGAMYLISAARNVSSLNASNRLALVSWRTDGSLITDIIANSNITISVSGSTITFTCVGTAILFGSILGLNFSY
jgi:hypothetical protein